jgi:hypothetical protein
VSIIGRRLRRKGQRTVEDCGAVPGAVLVGLGPSNAGLRVRVLQAQARGDGGPIKGDFVILAAGDNPHADALRPLVGWETNAEEVVVAVRRRHPTSVNPVNANILASEPCDGEKVVGRAGGAGV